MPLIKRYPNRKLYDTKNNKYINLNTIAHMISDGHDVQVVDHVTGEDLTALTFAQIIMEREKKERDFVPKMILAELIKSGGESINSILHKLSSPADLIKQVDQEISTRLEGLIKRGEIAEEDGRKLRDQLIINRQQWFNSHNFSDDDIVDALMRHDIPKKNDFQKIIDQLEALSAKLDR